MELVSPEEYAFADRMLKLREQDKGPKLMGVPDSWGDVMLWRCMNNHVSKWYVKSELRGPICPACSKIVMITYPDDLDGTQMREEV